MSQQKIPKLPFRSENIDFVERQIKRNMIISLKNGKNEFLDLNRGKFPINTTINEEYTQETRDSIVALRGMIGRDQLTINRKVDGEIIEGFFYHEIEREKMGSFVSLIKRERIGFCYNAQGDAIQFYFNYEDIIEQLNNREKALAILEKQIQVIETVLNLEREIITLESINWEKSKESFLKLARRTLKGRQPTLDYQVQLQEKIENIVASQLNFVINRWPNQKVNLLDQGMAIYNFYELDETELNEFQNKIGFDKRTGEEVEIKCAHAKYRDYLEEVRVYELNQEQRKINPTLTEIKEPLKVERPFIPRLPYVGTRPKTTFRIRESGNIG